MDQQTVIQQAIDKTFRELEESKKPQQRSRIAKTTNVYIFLIGWSNAQLLRILIRLFTVNLPGSEHRLKAQLDDAARSVIANIEEGYRRPTTMEYITFLGYSQASLTEVKGDIQRSLQDKFLKSISGSSLSSLHMNLMDWHEAVKQSVISKPQKNRGNYRNLGEPITNESYSHPQIPLNSSKILYYSTDAQHQTHSTSFSPAEALPRRQAGSVKAGTFLYPPVDNLQVTQLTYEVFIELINKTDWHLRRLVSSLEDKLNNDQKFYQVEKARVRGNTRWNR